jgi:ubiquinone/menaquinone biosynthesis C-methylase UbiE
MGYHIQDARQEFDGWSRRYDRDPLQKLLFKPSHRLMVRKFQRDEERILDIGCGTSQFAARVLPRFSKAEVVGLDLSRSMLRASQGRCFRGHNRMRLVQGDSQKLPFADDSFDLVTCSHSFHHYPNQLQVVSEMHRVLRPEGRLMIIDGDRDRWWGRLIFDVIVVLMEGRVKHLTGEAMAGLYREAGFIDIVQFRRRGFLPFLFTMGTAVKQVQVLRKAA